SPPLPTLPAVAATLLALYGWHCAPGSPRRPDGVIRASTAQDCRRYGPGGPTIASIFPTPRTARGPPLEVQVTWPGGWVASGGDAPLPTPVAGELYVAYPDGRTAHARFSVALVPPCATPGLYLSRYQGHGGYHLSGAARCPVRPADGSADDA